MSPSAKALSISAKIISPTRFDTNYSLLILGISDIIMKPGLVNVDFADVRTIMGNAGTFLFIFYFQNSIRR